MQSRYDDSSTTDSDAEMDLLRARILASPGPRETNHLIIRPLQNAGSFIFSGAWHMGSDYADVLHAWCSDLFTMSTIRLLSEYLDDEDVLC